jgi:subtilisin family serine protease
MDDWYVPAELPQTARFPGSSPIDEAGLAVAGAKWTRVDGGAPTIYSTYLLSISGAPPAADVVAELERVVSANGWSLWLANDHELRLGAENAANPPDAWVVLQALQSAGGLSDAAKELKSRLSLHRLAFIGMPAKEGHAGAQREAVGVPLIALTRRPVDQLPGGRRPVVAVLDSGIGQHEWMLADATDPVWVDAADLGWRPSGAPPVSQEDADFADADPRSHSHAGHGTFIAGLIRQLAPDARLLSMHVMRADGIVDESLVLSALEWLVDRVRGAAAHPERFVDVVSLSFGYYEQDPADSEHTAVLRRLLGQLGDMGVRVVASAGNHASDAPVFPGALTRFAKPGTVPRTELISVGALNPDLSQAAYSNYGDWVLVWTVGTGLISAMPARLGRQRVNREPAKEYDPDNLASGYARWSGTSFAAAVIAGQFAALVTDDESVGVTPDAAHARAHRALGRVA